MAGGFTTVGQVLQLIGQAPVEHGRKSATEKKRDAISTFPMFSPDGNGPLTGLLQQMVQNPGSLISNPIGGLTQALGGQLSGITGQLQSMISGGGLPGLSSLQTAIGSLSQGTGLQGVLSALSGASGALASGGSGGPFDLTAVRGLNNLISTVGQGVLPSHVTLEAALAPAYSGSLVNNIAEVLMPMASEVLGGADPSAMLAQVQAFTDQVQGVLDGSAAAFNGAFDAASRLGSLSVHMNGALDNPGGAFGNFLSMVQQPDAAAAIGEWAASIQARFDAVRAGEPGGTTSV